MAVLDRFPTILQSLRLPPGRALVAVSGGPDSVALLDLLVRTREQHRLELIVAHVDHGIHPESARVAEQVRTLAESYQVPFEVVQLELGSAAGETLARARRYRWLEAARVRLGAELIFTAHHADDQIETVLMRVLQGSGPAGLAGMAAVRGKLVRPLLSCSRRELHRHVRENGLSVWLDPANEDPRHLRSWIRAELLPLIRSRLPRVDANIERLSSQASRDRAAWDAALNVLPSLDLQLEAGAFSVAASGLEDYDSPLTQAILLTLARRAGCPLGPSRVGRVVALLQGGLSGSRVPLGGDWLAELAFGRLRIMKEGGHPEPCRLIEGNQGETAWGRWQFRWQRTLAPATQERTGLSAWFTMDPMTVRAWVPGEKVKPLGGTGRRLVVRCFQEVRVPRSRRPSWPVLAQGDGILWVPGVCRSDAGLPAEGTEALRVDAEYA